MFSTSRILSLLAVVNVAVTSPFSSERTLDTRAITGTKYIFSFGDSYSQTGFDPTLAHPSASNPLGNPAYPGYTTSGGPNWLDYLIETYNTSLTLDWNFSYGGATVDASLVAPYATTVLSFIDQVNQFTQYAASKPADTPWTSANSLFAVWLGVNDVGNSYYNSGEDTLLNEVVAKYFAEVQILYNAGARYFLFLTVPPIQKSPLMLAESTDAQTLEASTITSFNSKLATAAATFKANNTGITYWVVDTQAPFNTALANPTAYGATSDGATCFNADGVSCLWWNNYHPAMAIHKLVARAVASALSGSFFGSGPATSTSSTSTSKPATSTSTSKPATSTTKVTTTVTTAASSTTSKTTTSKTTTTTAPTGAPLYGQCGGKGWTGPTTCASGTCKYSNDWYSQCL